MQQCPYENKTSAAKFVKRRVNDPRAAARGGYMLGNRRRKNARRDSQNGKQNAGRAFDAQSESMLQKKGVTAQSFAA